MKLSLKMVGITALSMTAAGILLFLNLHHFDSLYQNRGRRMSELSGQMLLARGIQVDFKKQVQEWKDLLLRGHHPEDLQKYQDLFRRRESDVVRGVSELLDQVQSPQARKKLEEFRAAHGALGERYRTALSAFIQTFDAHEVDGKVRGMDRPPTDLIDEVVSAIELSYKDTRTAQGALWESEWRQAVAWSSGVFVILLVTMGFLGMSLTRPIVSLARMMKEPGDPSQALVRKSSRRKDEIGDLFIAFDQMVKTAREHERALLLESNALADREARLRSFTQSVSDGILSADASGLVLTWNRAASEILGYSAEEVLGKPLLMLIPAQDQKLVSDTMSSLVADDPQGPRQARLGIEGLRKDGTAISLDMSLASWRTGADVYLGAILRDVTEQKKVERLKEEFISTVSHELRTPLTAIRGSLGLLVGGVVAEIPPMAKGMIELAHRNCERLARLVNDILDIDKIESGKMTFAIKQHDAGALVRQALEMNRGFGDQLGVAFVLQECPDRAAVMTDPDRFLQVMANLVSNAAKFSPRGQKVVVSVKKEYGKVRIEVRDCGPGIPDEFRKRIFQKFAQAETSDARVRQGQGTGLGLTISKAIVERLKGTLGFETQLGVGTAFFFTLPLMAEPGAARATGDGPYGVLCGLDASFAQVASQALERYGIKSARVPEPSSLGGVATDPNCRVVFVPASTPREELLPWLSIADDRPPSTLFRVGQPQDLGTEVSPHVRTVGSSTPLRGLASILHRVLSPPEQRHARILHLESSQAERDKVLETLGPIARLITTSTVEESWNLLREQEVDLLLLELYLSDGCSLDLIPLLRGLGREGLPVVLLSDARTPSKAPSAVRAVLSKSRTSPEQLMAVVRALVCSTPVPPGTGQGLPERRGWNRPIPVTLPLA